MIAWCHAGFIQQKGRMAIAELAAVSNRLIDLESKQVMMIYRLGKRPPCCRGLTCGSTLQGQVSENDPMIQDSEQ